MYFTSNLIGKLEKEDIPLWRVVEGCMEKAMSLPAHTHDGGDDKEFFVLNTQGLKMYVAKNETNTYTIMLPEDY